MKNNWLIAFLLILGSIFTSKAQHIRARMRFPAAVSIRATVPAPSAGAVWIGPEWAWRGGQYVHVPGYWAQPPHRKARWIAGSWRRSRMGFIWIAGRWK